MINIESYRNRTNPDDIIKIATYGRVSTEHEAQINALSNQLQYYDDLISRHPNWQLTKQYVDEGISGTLAKKRPAFLQMVEDAKAGKFSLLITREVSRLCRNTKESLQYVDILKEKGVEIYFTEDNIWSLDPGDDFKLGMMSLLAEQESKKTGERVKAGQMISRQNGIIYGSGNVLGYDLVLGKKSCDNHYVINPEQSETVKRIFQLYLHEGLGMKRISSQLIKEKRRNASGLIKWDATIISRVLSNRLYSGYLTYRQSTTISPISHKRVKNTNRDTYEYMKSDKVPPIISDDTWQKVQIKRKKRMLFDPATDKCIPRNLPQDVWRQLLKCQCGKSFRRYKWRVNKTTQEVCFGYQCVNVVNNHKKSYREAHGITENDGFCNQKSIPEWKLNFMFSMIMKKLWRSPGRTISRINKMIDQCYVQHSTDMQITSKQKATKQHLEEEKAHIEKRKKNLLEMRLEGSIDGAGYMSLNKELDTQLQDVENQLAELKHGEDEAKACDVPDINVDTEEIKQVLKECSALDVKKLDNDLILQFVDRVIVYEDQHFDWYIDLQGSDEDFEQKNYVFYQEFKLTFEEAKEYRKTFGNYIRKGQWGDVKVKVYVCV